VGLGALDGEVGEPAGEVPVGVAEQGHGGGDEEGADDGGVEEDGDGQAEARLLEGDQFAGGEAGEDDHRVG
jgi:hypothetical protein